MIEWKPVDLQLKAAKRLFTHIGEVADGSICVRLWDGEIIPLGDKADPRWYIAVNGPDVLGALLRRPTLENFVRQYALGNIDFCGGSLIDFYAMLRKRGERTKGVSSKQLKRRLNKWYVLWNALWLLFSPKPEPSTLNGFEGDARGRNQSQRDEEEYSSFHYDLSNDFYRIFLGPEMQYSCAYFHDWEQGLEQAQLNKLEMICRKLRLQPGERLLDIGCGWGGLLVYAVRNYDVTGHGITLSRQQYNHAVERVYQLGLDKRITIEFRDYLDLDGKYDKIASIGMYEHIGIANYTTYFSHLHNLLEEGGILLNHGITRRAKHNRRRFARITPGRKLILKYVFPGTELDHIGHTAEKMEACGFEVQDVEAWREHYARTTMLWCRRLENNREQAIRYVGEQRFRMWIAYLAGVSFAFQEGSLRVFQTIGVKNDSQGKSAMPPTREYLYS